MTNKERLQKELGDGFRVLRWVNNQHFKPDEVVVSRVIDDRYECFNVDKECAGDPLFRRAFRDHIRGWFRDIPIQNPRLNAFEHIVRNQKLPLPLARLANNTRYESMETEWAFRFYCEGLNACVGWSTGNEQQPTKSA